MTADMTQKLAKTAGYHDDGPRSVSSSSEVVGNTLPMVPEKDEVTLEDRVPPAEHRSMRVRTPRVLTNVAALGEIHFTGDVTPMEDADSQLKGCTVYAPEPITHQQSVNCAEAKHWSRARRNERLALEKRRVFDVCKIPPGVQPINSKYVYKRKFNKSGCLKKYKARMVGLGYGQVAGVDVFNTFAPVVKSITVRLMFALALVFGLYIHQLDVSSAFLYADIEGDVYMHPTPDFDLPDGYCFKLRKSLYGLRSSPRSWWKTLDKFIKSMHFKSCVLEPCLYHTRYKGCAMYICIYVDDIIIACSDVGYIKEVKARFCSRFDMTDMGELEHFLNVRVTRTKDCIRMDQTVYINKVLEVNEEYLGPTGKTRKQPLPATAMDAIGRDDSSEATNDEQSYLDNFPYRSLLGALLYLSMNTRPDISYAVGVLSRLANKPTLVTCKLMVYLMQYVRGTVDKGINFSGSDFDMHVFTDADWAGDTLTRRSTTGYVVFGAGGPIAWQSKLQTTVSTSSMQSEYQAMYAGMQELVWLRGVMAELSLPCVEPTPFFLDSQSAEDLALNPVYHKRSKHIEIKYHWVREHVNPDGPYRTAQLVHVRSADQSADLYTKALVGSMLETHRTRNLGEKRKSSNDVRADNSRSQRRR